MTGDVWGPPPRLVEPVWVVGIQLSLLGAALRKKLADPAFREAFLAKAPEGGTLVIHHTPGTWEGSFQAAVSYDVGSFGQTSQFDAGGAKVVLPTEH